MRCPQSQVSRLSTLASNLSRRAVFGLALAAAAGGGIRPEVA